MFCNGKVLQSHVKCGIGKVRWSNVKLWRGVVWCRHARAKLGDVK